MLKKSMWFLGGALLPIIAMVLIAKALDFMGVSPKRLGETPGQVMLVLLLLTVITCLMIGEQFLKWANGRHALAGMLWSIILFTAFISFGWLIILNQQ